MSRNKLYYWVLNYENILPQVLPDEDWVSVINPVINSFLKMNYGNREMIFDSLEYLDFAPDSDILAWIKEKIGLLFTARNESYKRIFEGFTAEYNPLWNVDGTEIEKHTGKDTTKNSGTDTVTNSGTDARTIETTDDTDTTHGGTTTDSVHNSGTDETIETHGGTDATNNNVAAFDLVSPVLANSSQTLNGHTINTELEHGLQSARTINHGETISENGTHETSDSFAHGHVVTTQNGKQTEDEYNSTITRTRTGNIGVTKSTELLKDHLELWNGLSFLDMIAKDIVNTICYSVI